MLATDYKQQPQKASMDLAKWALFDDDRAFRLIMESVARMHGICLETFESLQDLGSMSLLKNYRLIIVDHHLHQWKGYEIAEYSDVFFKETPVMIVSSDPDISLADNWPKVVKKFAPKSLGPEMLIKEALKIENAKAKIA